MATITKKRQKAVVNQLQEQGLRLEEKDGSYILINKVGNIQEIEGKLSFEEVEHILGLRDYEPTQMSLF